jgi:hypothetical protein
MLVVFEPRLPQHIYLYGHRVEAPKRVSLPKHLADPGVYT